MGTGVGPSRDRGGRSARPGAFGLAVAWVAVLLAGGPWAGLHPSMTSGAETLAPEASTLEPPRYAMAAVWDGKHVFLFGGANNDRNFDEILRYDPKKGTLDVMSARLPTPRYLAAAAWDGRNAYLFGGTAAGGSIVFDEVVRYDPSADKVEVMSARLPSARYGASAVWTGDAVLVLGGRDATVASLRDVLKYDPSTDTLTRMDASLPHGTYGASAIWDGQQAYVLGGWESDAGNANGRTLDAIVRFDPATNELRVMDGRLPTGRWGTTASWDGRAAYLYGGDDVSDDLDQIVRYVPAFDTVQVLSDSLPTGRRWVAAVAHGANAYVFGGYDGQFLGDVLRLDTQSHEPVIILPAVPAAECVAGVATVRLDASASFDLDGDPVRFSWTAPGITFDDPQAPAPAAVFPLGATPVTVAVTDSLETAIASAIVRVVDRFPPELELVRPAADTLYVNDEEAAGPFRAANGAIAAVGPLTFVAEAHDACGVASVRFQFRFQSPAALVPNFPVVATDPAPPYAFRFDPRPYDSGDWQADVTAVDLAGNPSDVATRLVHEVGTSCKVGGPVEQVCGLLPSSP